MDILQEDLILNELIKSELPKLKIVSQEYTALLANDQEAYFDMEAIVNNTLRDSEAFSDLSNYLFNVLLKTHQQEKTFDIFNFYDRVPVLSSGAAVFALILFVKLHFKIKGIFLLLASSRQANAEKLILPTFFYLKTEPTSTAVSEMIKFQDYLACLKEILPVEFSVLICCILGISMTIYLYTVCQKTNI